MTSGAAFEAGGNEAAPAADSFALLLRASDGADPALPLVIALHDRGGDAAAAIAHVRMLFGDGPRVLAPPAARPSNPLQSNGASARSYSGFSWYLGSDAAVPEPASFGDALCQIELLLRDQGACSIVCGTG